jgi:hypothetical protein
MTWPWARVVWAYGFTLVGATALAAVSFTLWSMASSSPSAKPIRVKVQTSQSFRIDQSQ